MVTTGHTGHGVGYAVAIHRGAVNPGSLIQIGEFREKLMG